MNLPISKKINWFIGDLLVHYCPGCKQLHPVYVNKPSIKGARWTWYGLIEAPTFEPSFNIPGVCHYWIREGQIIYLSDSTHDLSGCIVDLPDIPEDLI